MIFFHSNNPAEQSTSKFMSMLRHKKKKIKRWLYSSSSNWYFSSWWNADKRAQNLKSWSSVLKSPFQKSSDSTSYTEKKCYNYLYWYTVEIYREVSHLPIHALNCKAYKQHDYLLKGLWFLVFGNRAVTSLIIYWVHPNFISRHSTNFFVLPKRYSAHACGIVAVYVHHRYFVVCSEAFRFPIWHWLLLKASIYDFNQ